MTNTLFENWINSPHVSAADKKQMQQYTPEQIAAYFSNQPLSFGTAGIRATMGPGTRQMNEFTYRQFTIGYAKFLLKHFVNPSIIIGHDNRNNGKEFSLVCADVLTSMGIKVYLFKDNHEIPTPIVSYLIRQMNLSGGIIITASHNPKEYNGYKVYNPDGGQILPDVANEIQELMPKVNELLDLRIVGNHKLQDEVDEKYISKYFADATCVLTNKEIIEENKTFPFVINTNNGAGSSYYDKFLRDLNFHPTESPKQCVSNPDFAFTPYPNPEDPRSFNQAIVKAQEIDAKLCLGIDPDSDRMAVMVNHHGQWRLMTGNEMGIIYTYYKLNHLQYAKPPFIVASHVSTNYIDIIAKDFNAQVLRTGTGFKWMGHCVTENCDQMDFVVAFEEAIGALPTTINRDKDGFTATLLTLEIHDDCLKNNMDLVDYLQKIIFKKYGGWFGKTDSFIISGFDWKTKATQLMEYYKKYSKKTIGDCQIQSISWNKVGDCLEWQLANNEWIKFRMSGTEPKFKAYYELYGNDVGELTKRYEKLHNILKEHIEA